MFLNRLAGALVLVASAVAMAQSKAPAGMTAEVDKVEGITWYRDATAPKYHSVNSVHAYFGVKPGLKPWLRMRFQYADRKWLFVRSAIVIADGQRFDLATDRWERDHDSRIWEWLDAPADEKLLRAIASAKKVTVRYEGRQYHDDREVTAKQRAAITRTLAAFKAMGG